MVNLSHTLPVALHSRTNKGLYNRRVALTAEVALLNRQAIALAADSAVTIGRERVWKTANKLFSLGPTHDIALMIHGSGDFLSFPWEVVVKEYRKQANAKTFKTTQDCVSDFMAFLSSEKFSDERGENNSVLYPLVDYIEDILDAVSDDGSAIDIARVLERVIRVRKALERQQSILPDLDEKGFIERFSAPIAEYIDFVFENAETDELKKEAAQLVLHWFRSKRQSSFSTGVVIAGFGEDELFPCLYFYAVDGRVGSDLRTWEVTSRNLTKQKTAVIAPFAQQDMSFLFMEGISDSYLAYLRRGIRDLLSETLTELTPSPDDATAEVKEAATTAAAEFASKAADRFMEKFASHRHETFVSPVMSALGALPKEEMAAMAEALVDLTSLRRKVDSNLETVGGPVDVAVISKGDGFVWIKRKHYFKPELNPDFPRRKSRVLGED